MQSEGGSMWHEAWVSLSEGRCELNRGLATAQRDYQADEMARRAGIAQRASRRG